MRGRTFPVLVHAARHDPAVAARVRLLVSGVPLALYDLERDPDERDNLIDVPGYAVDVARLADVLLAEMERTSDPLLAPLRAALGERARLGPGGFP